QRLLLAQRHNEGVQRQQPLGRPAPVDRRLADPGPRGHLLDRHGGQAPVGEQFDGGGEDRAVRFGAARPSPLRTRVRGSGSGSGSGRRNIPAHRPVLLSGIPKRSVTYLIGIMPATTPLNRRASRSTPIRPAPAATPAPAPPPARPPPPIAATAPPS